MRRRHRIKDVRIYAKEGRAGIQLITKSGIVTLPCCTDRPGVIYHRITHFVPHMYEALIEYNAWDEDHLKALMVGHYLYGEVTEVERDGMISTVIQ